MKSRMAYRMLKTIFKLLDQGGGFVVDTIWKKRLAKSRRAGEGRTFRYLEEASYIKRLEGDRFRVTDLAKINLLREAIKRRKPDGKLRLVLFDIPEKLKHHRNFFRKHLVELGFRMAQQSVWVSSLPCEDLVRLVIRYHGLGRYVELAVGEIVANR